MNFRTSGRDNAANAFGIGAVIVAAAVCTPAADGQSLGHDALEVRASPALFDEAGLYERRMAYRRAAYAARAGRRSDYREGLAELADYALRPYLVFYDARRRASGLSTKLAQEVRAELAGTPLQDAFFDHWLESQASNGRWKTYLDNYEPTYNVVARCHYLRALIISGRPEEAYQQVPGLWLSPRSQPDECDPAFQSWINAGRLDQETAWTRLLLALGENEVTLARYLLRFFDRANAGAARLTYDAHVRPQLVRSLSRFADNELGRRALGHGIVRYAKRDVERALGVWREARQSYDFAPEQRRSIQSQMMAEAANAGLVPDDGPIGYTAALTERVAEGLIRHGLWPEAILWITALPPEMASQGRWRYWLGRSLIDSGEGETA
ncbi:MAG: hypothetical protein OXP36_11605, partial [Gammaproteobacteria bacterium]|nr:hypothetical protein [Gammaproteobacteria bacterium]